MQLFLMKKRTNFMNENIDISKHVLTGKKTQMMMTGKHGCRISGKFSIPAKQCNNTTTLIFTRYTSSQTCTLRPTFQSQIHRKNETKVIGHCSNKSALSSVFFLMQQNKNVGLCALIKFLLNQSMRGAIP